MNYRELVRIAEERLFIIGEAGVNHNGSVSEAKKLVDAACYAGCDAVKFQTWITEKVYSKELSQKPEYQKEVTPESESEFETIKKLELSFESFREIKAYCEQKGILFFSTPDERDSADFLCEGLGVELLKTASQDVTNTPFLRYLARKRLPLIFSTGGCSLGEMMEGANAILAETSELIVLHCVSSYPAPVEQQNLRFISALRTLFDCPVGFSDHTGGVEAACAAVALGASVFEKHFTLDRTSEGPDHQASMEPESLKRYVSCLRGILSSLGDGKKRIMPCEAENASVFRRYLVTARPLNKGQLLQERDLVFIKATAGIAPRFLDCVEGTRLRFDVPKGALLEWRHLEFL